eukprot:m.143289 g.143289  ORF g.143289 m.143289 type:complete len:1020 (+) comp30309_c0_seq1:159-3218(+)
MRIPFAVRVFGLTLLCQGAWGSRSFVTDAPCDYDVLTSEGGGELAKHGIGHYEAFSLDGDILLSRHQTHQRARRGLERPHEQAADPLSLSIQAHGRVLHLRLKAAENIFHPDFSVEFVSEGNTSNSHEVEFDRSVFYHGHVEGENSSAISAYIEGDILIGTIHIAGDDEYFIERASNYLNNSKHTNIIYRGSDIVENEGYAKSFEGGDYEKLLQKQKKQESPANLTSLGRQRAKRQVEPYDPSKNTCEVALVGDHLFMTLFQDSATGEYRKTEATRSMVSLLDGASLVFRATAFTPWTNKSRTSSGLAQFSLKKVYLYDDTQPTVASDNPYLSMMRCGSGDSCPSTVECAQPFLDSLTAASAPSSSIKAGETQRGWDNYCLVHAFTQRDFCGGILGLAWVARAGANSAGICAKRTNEGKSLNTGISTSINFGTQVSKQVQTITLAHEFGHNFGSSHDVPEQTHRDTGESCAPMGAAGNYIMYLKATDGDEVNNNKFSACSKSVISEVLAQNSGDCFVNREAVTCGSKVMIHVGSSCSNGILDYGEECDCSTIDGEDPCCDCATCKVKEPFECSYKIDPHCCSQDCTLKGVSLNETLYRYEKAMKHVWTNHKEGTTATLVNTQLAKEMSGLSTKCSDDEANDCVVNQYCIADKQFVPYKGQERGSCPQQDWIVSDFHTYNSTSAVRIKEPTQDVCYNFSSIEGCNNQVRCESLIPSCIDYLSSPEHQKSINPDCYLFHLSEQTKCNNEQNLCTYNGCTGSICNRYKKEDNPSLSAEKCRLDEPEKACHVACIFNGSTSDPGPCISVKDHAEVFPDSTQVEINITYLSNGRTCTYDSDRYGGRCEDQLCVPLATDGIDDVSVDTVTRWIEENWQVVVGLIVGIIVLVVALKLTYKKKKPQLKRAAKNMMKTLRSKTGTTKKLPKGALRPDPGGGVRVPPPTSGMRKQMHRDLRKGEAVKRLMCFFPDADDDDVRSAFKHTASEEDAVKRLLKKGFAFAIPTEVPLPISTTATTKMFKTPSS